jgi:hypothetical protein
VATQYKVTGWFGSSGERDSPRASTLESTYVPWLIQSLNARLNDTSTSFVDSLGMLIKIHRAMSRFWPGNRMITLQQLVQCPTTIALPRSEEKKKRIVIFLFCICLVRYSLISRPCACKRKRKANESKRDKNLTSNPKAPLPKLVLDLLSDYSVLDLSFPFWCSGLAAFCSMSRTENASKRSDPPGLTNVHLTANSH